MPETPGHHRRRGFICTLSEGSQNTNGHPRSHRTASLATRGLLEHAFEFEQNAHFITVLTTGAGVSLHPSNQTFEGGGIYNVAPAFVVLED